MAKRIPDAIIEEIDTRTDLTALVSVHVPLKKTGRYWFGRCPFHQEKTASFSVDPMRNRFHCFGCGVSGSPIQFLMRIRHLGFAEAAEELARPLGLVITREIDPQADAKKQALDWIQRAVHAYQQALRTHPLRQKAVDYLRYRGITGKTAQQFGLGYAPPDGIGIRHMLSGGDPHAYVEAGLMRFSAQGTPRELWFNRLIFPIRDVRGRYVGLGGRLLDNRPDAPKYMNSPESLVFHKRSELYGLYEALSQRGPLHALIVVEGYMDVLALSQAGIRGAVATLGTAVGSAHIEKALRYTSELVFCFDGDPAGQQAAEKAMQLCIPFLRQGRIFRVLVLPEGEDPDSFIQKAGPDPQGAFEALKNQAPGWADWVWTHVQRGFDLQRVEDRIQCMAAVKNWVDPIPDPVYRQLLEGMVAQDLGVALPADPLAGNPRTPKRARGVYGLVGPSAPDASRMPGKPRGRPATVTWVERAVAMLLKRPGICDQIAPDVWARFQACCHPQTARLEWLPAHFPLLWELITWLFEQGDKQGRSMGQGPVDVQGTALEGRVEYLLEYAERLGEPYWADEVQGILERLIAEYQEKERYAALLAVIPGNPPPA